MNNCRCGDINNINWRFVKFCHGFLQKFKIIGFAFFREIAGSDFPKVNIGFCGNQSVDNLIT
ncbi:MAG: hypothetical protein A2W80_10900 [Candidatus Riflebacteria bacterium GWC2_50_8]|nr:MAG: hypothetical protein A2W80_10900 [Candidatus Riflebacteria bacterium GWC2_50_8]